MFYTKVIRSPLLLTMAIKLYIITLLQSRKLFSFWLLLNHYTAVFLNFYRGAAPVHLSGECYVLDHILARSGSTDSPLFIDCGANKGAYTDLVLKYFQNNATLYLFEPTPRLHTYLKSKYFRYPNVTIYNVALSSSTGEQLLRIDPSGDQLNSLCPVASTPQLDDQYLFTAVNAVSLDDFCIQNNTSRIRLLKIDVEGAEPDVLSGAKRIITSRAVDYIQLEYSSSSISKMSFKGLLECYGDIYNFYIVCSDGLKLISTYSSCFEAADCMILLLELV